MLLQPRRLMAIFKTIIDKERRAAVQVAKAAEKEAAEAAAMDEDDEDEEEEDEEEEEEEEEGKASTPTAAGAGAGGEGGLGGAGVLEQLLGALEDARVVQLLRYCRDWNTRAKVRMRSDSLERAAAAACMLLLLLPLLPLLLLLLRMLLLRMPHPRAFAHPCSLCFLPPRLSMCCRAARWRSSCCARCCVPSRCPASPPFDMAAAAAPTVRRAAAPPPRRRVRARAARCHPSCWTVCRRTRSDTRSGWIGWCSRASS